MLWKKPVLSSWNWERNLVVLGYIWKWNWKKCFNYYGRYCSYILAMWAITGSMIVIVIALILQVIVMQDQWKLARESKCNNTCT